MIRKFLFTIALAAVSFLASAQYKVTSIDHEFGPGFELKYIFEGESSTFIYGTFTSQKKTKFYFNRALAVYQDDMKYKVKNAVHLPVYDEADEIMTVFDEEGQKVNFVVEFERFPAKYPFDIIETDKPNEGGTYLNVYGIKTEEMEAERFPDFDKFVDRYPVTFYGRYKDNGANVQYYMRDGVYVSCRSTECEGDLFEPNYYRFLIEINNDSDHGIAFSFDKTYVMGHRKVGKKDEDKVMIKYTPDSFEDYLASEDYYEAQHAVGGTGLKDVGWKLRSESYNRDNSEWANLGLKILGNMANQLAEQNIQEYLAAHPKNRPGVLRSQSLKAGDGISGYFACKKNKNDSYTIHIPMDDYDFAFDWR